MTWKELAELSTKILAAHWKAILDSKRELRPREEDEEE